MPSGVESNPAPGARQAAYALRARTRYLTPSQRERGCGCWSVLKDDEGSDPYVEVRREHGIARARWCGLLQCGHIWTCPVCSLQKRAKRAQLFDAALRGLGGRWQMLTVTLRHREGMPLAVLLSGLMKAWRRCRQGGRVQAIWTRNVSASARATEIPYGDNGWHVHLHVVLRTPEWSGEERRTLLEAFQNAIRTELGPACVPSDLRALHWSDSFDGRDESKRGEYISKCGLELAGFGKARKYHADGTPAGLTSWQLAERAVEGDQKALRLWSEYYAATKGRRAFELDERAAAAGKAQLLDDAFAAAEGRDEYGVDSEAIPEDPPVRVQVKTRDFWALRGAERHTPSILAFVLRDIELEGSASLARWLAYARSRDPCRSSSPPPTSSNSMPQSSQSLTPSTLQSCSAWPKAS